VKLTQNQKQAMSEMQYQSWEEELEAPELEENKKAVIPMILAAIFGLLIFVILLMITYMDHLFKNKARENDQQRVNARGESVFDKA
jgi:hypothetical protein